MARDQCVETNRKPMLTGGKRTWRELSPYLYPSANLDWLFYTFFGELAFMLWLLIGSWFIKEPALGDVR